MEMLLKPIVFNMNRCNCGLISHWEMWTDWPIYNSYDVYNNYNKTLIFSDLHFRNIFGPILVNFQANKAVFRLGKNLFFIERI